MSKIILKEKYIHKLKIQIFILIFYIKSVFFSFKIKWWLYIKKYNKIRFKDDLKKII